jgi:hypothetical protein
VVTAHNVPHFTIRRSSSNTCTSCLPSPTSHKSCW